MSMTAVVLILVSAAIHVGWNLLTKSSGNPKMFSLLKGTLMSGVALVVLAALPLGEVPSGVWLLVLASGAIHFVYILALSTAYETGDISYVYPIARSAPALVPAAAFWFLGETVSVRGGAGIVMVIVAVAFLQFRGGAGAGADRSAAIRRDTLWAFLTLFAVVAYTLVDKAAMVRFARITAIPARWHGPASFHAAGGVLLPAVLALPAGLRTAPDPRDPAAGMGPRGSGGPWHHGFLQPHSARHEDRAGQLHRHPPPVQRAFGGAGGVGGAEGTLRPPAPGGFRGHDRGVLPDRVRLTGTAQGAGCGVGGPAHVHPPREKVLTAAKRL